MPTARTLHFINGVIRVSSDTYEGNILLDAENRPVFLSHFSGYQQVPFGEFLIEGNKIIFDKVTSPKLPIRFKPRPTISKKCNCSIKQLMSKGCTCGGI